LPLVTAAAVYGPASAPAPSAPDQWELQEQPDSPVFGVFVERARAHVVARQSRPETHGPVAAVEAVARLA
jgi:hypothetical protein